MANHKSAKKRARQALVRRARNRSVLSGVRTELRALRGAIQAGDGARAQSALRSTESHIRRAASKGVMKKTTANRQVSRLAHAVHALTR